MRRCPRCQREIGDNAAFCQNCGTSVPVVPQVSMAPAQKSGGKKGVMAVMWASLVVNVLLIALLVSWTLGVFGPSAQEQKLQAQVEDLEEQLQDLEDDRLSGTIGDETPDQPTDPDDDSWYEPEAPTTAPTTVPTEPPRESYTIRVWTPSEDQADGNSWLREMQARFDQAHPEYEITWVNEVVHEGDAAGVVTYDVTGAADVYMFANDQLSGLVAAGGLSKLGGDFETQVLVDNSQFAIDTVTHSDGSIYGFPVSGNTWFLYYNKDVFTEEDVRSLDTMLSKGKVCVPLTIGWNSGCFFLGTGGTVFGPAGNDASAGIDFGGQKGYTAAKKMLEVADHPNCVPGGMDVGMLMDGEVGAVFSGSWSASELQNALGDKLGVAMLPTFEADGMTYNMTALSGTKCVGVNPYTGSVAGKQKVCTQFAAFLASQEGQLLRYEMRGVIPIATALMYDEAIMADPVAMAEMQTILYCSVVQSSLPEMANYWSPVETFGKGCVNGDINMDNYMDMVDIMMEQLNARGL